MSVGINIYIKHNSMSNLDQINFKKTAKRFKKVT